MSIRRDQFDPDQDPRRLPIQALLQRNFQAMILVYGVFTIGWLLLLFTEQTRVGAFLMIGPFGAFAIYSRLRDRRIRRLGFSEANPYPSSWSEDFHDREPEAFKAFTTFWIFAFFAWAVLKYLFPGWPGSCNFMQQ